METTPISSTSSQQQHSNFSTQQTSNFSTQQTPNFSTQACQRDRANIGAPVLQGFPVQQPTTSSAPAGEILRDLELESVALKELHAKLADQLHRLQFEEVVLKKQMEVLKKKEAEFYNLPRHQQQQYYEQQEHVL
eukprot:TRINITY_DN1633_c0_g1_i4.p1 TRINITY_DN1633_c0_g1~~TRINITY_DN1633_c0_g1_i4.p1  ORF type:complete len:135 (+),score=61.11 TRINITY_DN1633_c0_g1_i4:151-555(+)